LVLLLGFVLSAAQAQEVGGTALVRHAPTLNGRVEGSIRQMTAENATLNGNAQVTGDLLVPGTPTVRLNGSPSYGGTHDGTGSATPFNHTITFNGGAALRHVVRRSDALALPVVAAPPPPAGTRSVSLNKPGQPPGDFATLKNLTLNSNVGQIAVPPGTYGNFTANSGSGFTLGVAGATTPAAYNFQNLTLNSNSRFTVAGPVVVTVDGGFSTNTGMGSPEHPDWLWLRIAGGGLSLAGNRIVYARLEAPAGALTLNGGSQFIGAVTSDRLIVNGNSLLRLLAPAVTDHGLPFLTGFEPAEGYQPGPLDGQQGWQVDGAANVVMSPVYAGLQAVAVPLASPPALLVRAFVNTVPGVAFVDLSAQPAAAATAADGVFFETDATRVALTGAGLLGTMQGLDGDGTGGGTWVSTGQGPTLETSGRAAGWLRLTVRADYTGKKWDLYLNGRMIAADLGFVTDAQATFSGLGLGGHTALATGFDNLLVAFDNPLFADADHDGMDDAWEAAHGLDSAVNDRDGDADVDGLTNVQEYVRGTDPDNSDTDGDLDNDGLSDAWEQQYFGHIGVGPAADADGDGVGNLAEFLTGRNPTKGAVPDTTGVVNLRVYSPDL
jgi:hypothetical protein